MRYPVSITPQITKLLHAGAPVAVGVSGGKDSCAVAIRLNDYLTEIGHHGPRILIHSDLGVVEWKDSLPACQRLARRLGWDLVVVRRKAGDLMDRWEKRWSNNVERYESLSCVKLILPWSTPSMRFCTSELKTDIICAELKRRYPGQQIVSVTGIRHDESANRAKMPCMQIQPKLTKKEVTGYNWNAIIEWKTPEVYQYLEEVDEPLHEAYRHYGCSRVSCVFCIMSAGDDLQAATACEDNHDLYRRMVDLEIASTFGLQGSRWLGDVAPHLLTDTARAHLEKAKQGAATRARVESLLPKHLLYVAGWPVGIPTKQEAELIGEVRTAVAAAVGLQVRYTTAISIRDRYAELIEQRNLKKAA